MCGGGGKGLSQSSMTQSMANPWAMAQYAGAVNQVNQATSAPFKRYSDKASDYISPLTGTQTGAISNISGMAGMTDPYYMAAAGLTGAGAQGVGRLTGQQIQEYMSPYMSQVIDPTRQAIQQQSGQQLAQQQAEAIRSGAFGGERAGLQRQALRGQQALGLGQALSPLYQTGYGQALQTAQGQQAVEQANLQRLLAAGQQFGGLGTAAQQAALQQAQAQLQAGTLEQQTATAGLQALYGEAQKERMYPLQAAAARAQGIAALAPLTGSQSAGYTLQPFFGGLAAAGGAINSPERMGGAVMSGGDYADGGMAEDVAFPSFDIHPSRTLEAPELPKRQEGSGLGKALVHAGIKAGANYLMPGSGEALNAAGFAEGGLARAGYATEGAVEGIDPALDYMARTMVREAAGEGPEGMRAVGHVIANRLAAGRYGKDIPSIVTAPKQFSPWNAEARGTRADPRLVDPSSSSYQTALGLARDIQGGKSEDPTAGATHFYNPDLASPKWGAGMQNALDIGHHRFGRADAGADQRAIGKAIAGLGPRERSMMALYPEASESRSPTTGGLGSAQVSDKGFLERIEEKPERLIVPILQGLGAMAGSRSRYAGSALLEGLGAGAGSYMDMQQKEADILKRRQEAATEAEETRRKGEEATKLGGVDTQKVAAEIAQTKGLTEKLASETVDSSIQVKDGRTFIRYAKPDGTYDWMPYSDYLSLPYDKKPAVDPRALNKIEADPSLNQAGAAAPPSAAPTGSPTSAPTKIELSPDVGNEAYNIARRKSGWSSESRAAEPDYFTPQDQIARGIESEKQQLLPMAAALSSLPQEKSLLASGKAQEVLQPIASVLNNLAAVAGKPGLIVNPEDLANTEAVKKFVNQLQQSATNDTQLRAVAAFRDMAEGIPSASNSPLAQGELISQILTNKQRELDRNKFFQDWKAAASGKRGEMSEWAKLSSREANQAFDKKYGNAFYAAERAGLRDMFKKPLKYIGEDGKTKQMSYLTALATYPSLFDDKQLDRIEKEHPGLLRYFGINR